MLVSSGKLETQDVGIGRGVHI